MPNFNTELDYTLRYFSNSTRVMKRIEKTESSESYFIPEDLISFIDKKVQSIKRMYENLDIAILWAEA